MSIVRIYFILKRFVLHGVLVIIIIFLVFSFVDLYIQFGLYIYNCSWFCMTNHLWHSLFDFIKTKAIEKSKLTWFDKNSHVHQYINR